MPVVYAITGAASQNPMHLSSDEVRNKCREMPLVAPIPPKICRGVVFEHA